MSEQLEVASIACRRGVGLVVRKIGMSRMFNDDGVAIAVTVVLLENQVVIARRTKEVDGYNAVVVGAGSVKSGVLSKPMRKYFELAGVVPSKLIREFRTDGTDSYSVGDTFRPSYFVAGQKVDVSGISLGKGFAGTVKRHNFSGLFATHGVSLGERSQGSTGGCQDPGKVFKNKKMAGHMGACKVTEIGVEVLAVYDEHGTVVLKGSVPGSKGAWLVVRDSSRTTS